MGGLILNLSDGKATLPDDSLEICFKDIIKAKKDMKEMEDVYNSKSKLNQNEQVVYTLFKRFLEMNKNNIKSIGFTNINDVVEAIESRDEEE